MWCPQCRHENGEAAKFCEECGTKLARACPGCGHEVSPGARFCPECGQGLTEAPRAGRLPSPQSYTPPHLAERIRAEQAAMEARGATEGERKTITALFADIKGSMELIEELDPEEARRLIDPALQLMMEAVHRYEGYVAQTLGDGIVALFGAPLAHEDHPQRALYAALKMQEEGRRYDARLRLERGIPLQIRVGINTGEVVMRSIRKDDLHTDYVPAGHSTGLAARMESLATPGSILVTEQTYRLTEGYFQFKPLGAARVQGVSEPVPIYEVLGVGPLRTKLQVSARRGLARFVGRQGELEQMRRALELAQGGHGQIVAVMGEPGVGKSRLYYEFKLLSQRGCRMLETFSISHGKAFAYLPLIELLKSYFEIVLQDDGRRVREKVTGKVLTLDRSLEDTLPYLLSLLGVSESTSSLQQMDSQIRRRRTFEAIKRLLLRESLNQPILVIFEDLHWLDGESLAFLDVLGESVATARILLLVNYRPEHRHAWGSKSYYTQLRLDLLGLAEAQELLDFLLGKDAGLKALKKLILEKTEGNPFFIEEIVQALFDQGVLVREAGVSLTRHLTEVHLPPTVQGVLAARIDRLPAEEKELLQTLAAMGKEFSLGLLKKVVGWSEEDLYRLLSRLQGRELIYERPAFPELAYTFKHALTQEVAYHSLLLERRRELHERTAQAIEELFGDRLEEQYRELAYHYSRSGNVEKALEYLLRAGRQAAQRMAYGEAIGHLTQGLELRKALPDTVERTRQELDFQTALGPALMAMKGYGVPEVEQAYNRARELCRQVGETPQLFRVLYGLLLFYRVRGEHQTALELGEQLLYLAQRAQDPAFLLLAYEGLGHTLFFLGESASGRAHFEQGIALYDPQWHRSLALLYGRDLGVSCQSMVPCPLWVLGYPDQALGRSHEALARARELSHPPSLAVALARAAFVHSLRREGQAAQEQAEAAIALCNKQGFAHYLAMGSILRGWALAKQGQREEGITQMRQGLDTYRATGTEVIQPYYLGLLAEAYGRGGQAQEGLGLLAEALAAVQKSGERVWEAELHRLKGEMMLALSAENQAEVETCFHQALDIARRQSAKSWELRATMSLSRLWQGQGKREEARQRLAEIYGWFTEGFDTPDLKEAKRLLEEMA